MVKADIVTGEAARSMCSGVWKDEEWGERRVGRKTEKNEKGEGREERKNND